MFKVGHVILADDIATSKFACDTARCKGACCVVGDAGAPVDRSEAAVLNRAWERLKDHLSPQAHRAVEEGGLIRTMVGEGSGLELACTETGECVFVVDRDGVAECAIQRAWQTGEFDWEKPISCHLYPIRLRRIQDMEFANFEYIPSLCGAACERGKAEGILLSDFLQEPLRRRYGEAWLEDFNRACRDIREHEAESGASGRQAGAGEGA